MFISFNFYATLKASIVDELVFSMWSAHCWNLCESEIVDVLFLVN